MVPVLGTLSPLPHTISAGKFMTIPKAEQCVSLHAKEKEKSSDTQYQSIRK
jgi:hypothetical protein